MRKHFNAHFGLRLNDRFVVGSQPVNFGLQRGKLLFQVADDGFLGIHFLEILVGIYGSALLLGHLDVHLPMLLHPVLILLQSLRYAGSTGSVKFPGDFEVFAALLLDHHSQKAYLTVGYLLSQLKVVSPLSLFGWWPTASKVWGEYPESVADQVQEI